MFGLYKKVLPFLQQVHPVSGAGIRTHDQVTDSLKGLLKSTQ